MGRKLLRALITAIPAAAMTVTLGGLAHADTYKEVRNLNSNKCLDVMSEDGYYNANARVQQYHCTGAAEQHWYPRNLGITDLNGVETNYYDFISQRSGKCLEVYLGGTFAGAQVVQNNCATDNRNLGDVGAQLWFRVNAGSSSYLVNYRSRMCLDISGASLGDRAKVQIWNCNGSGAQKFVF